MRPLYALKETVVWNGGQWQIRGRTNFHAPQLYDLAKVGVVSRGDLVFRVPESELRRPIDLLA